MQDSSPHRIKSNLLSNGNVPRRIITKIQFLDCLEDIPFGAWDVSEDNDGSIMAWVNDSVLTIAGRGGIAAPENCKYLFQDYYALTSICFNRSFITNATISMKGMFQNCSALTSLNLSDFNTGNVTDMSCMFDGCSSLRTLDLSSFDTQLVTDMNGMFGECSSLLFLDLSNFNTRHVTDMRDMFDGCSALRKLNLSGFDTRFSNSSACYGMFTNCQALKTVVLDGRRIFKVMRLYDELCDELGDSAVEMQTDSPLGREISDSWDNIISAIDDGTARFRYMIGDSKSLELGNLGSVKMVLAGFELDDRSDNQGKANTTWIASEVLIDHRMNPDTEYYDDGWGIDGTGGLGGWSASELRKYLNSTLLPAMPECLRRRIVSVIKRQNNPVAGKGWSNILADSTDDQLWIPSLEEVFGDEALYRELFPEIVYCQQHLSGCWWLRTAANSAEFYFIYSDYSGGKPSYVWYGNAKSSYRSTLSYNNSSCEYGVVLGFCL